MSAAYFMIVTVTMIILSFFNTTRLLTWVVKKHAPPSSPDIQATPCLESVWFLERTDEMKVAAVFLLWFSVTNLQGSNNYCDSVVNSKL